MQCLDSFISLWKPLCVGMCKCIHFGGAIEAVVQEEEGQEAKCCHGGT